MVKHTSGHFKAIGADMCLEQTINRSQKSSSGIIGSSRKKRFVAEWEIIYHEMLAVSNLHREICGVMQSAHQFVNHEFSQSETKSGENNIQAMITFITKSENPFEIPSNEPRLHNIVTQEVMSDDIRAQLLNVLLIGADSYQKLRQERFVNKSVRLSDTIHRTNLKTFQSAHPLSKSKTTGLKHQIKESSFAQRIMELARARGHTMDQLLKYDIVPTCHFFNHDGLMTTSVKSSLIHELETSLQARDYVIPDSWEELHTTCVADIMANIRKVRLKGLKSFGDL